MAISVTYDILVGGRMIITKFGTDPPQVNVEYTMEQDDSTSVQKSINKNFPYTPTAGETTTLNNFIAKIIGLIQTAEGL